MSSGTEDANIWDERYARPGYLFGTQPAQFLVDRADYLPRSGNVLTVADGEGRNSAFLAARGLEVIAFDASPVAMDKAKALAQARGVTIRYEVADVDGWDWMPDAYDAVVAIFVQFAAPPLRARLFRKMKRCLRLGGVLMLHGYRPEQIAYGTGGPPMAENMYTEDMLREAFGDMRLLHLAAYDAEIDEGTSHSGMSALIDLVAVKA